MIEIAAVLRATGQEPSGSAPSPARYPPMNTLLARLLFQPGRDCERNLLEPRIGRRREPRGSIKRGLLVTATLLSVLCGHSAVAATYTVNSAADAGTGSLRWAITQANATAGADTINIAIGSGVRTITLASALPAITDGVYIDAGTQPGYANVPLIQLSGASAAEGVNGFLIAASGVTIRAFAIIRFKDNGIVINGGGNIVRDCHIGLDSSGAAAGNSENGVFVTGSSNQILANAISANGLDGVRVDQSASSDNQIHNNWIGSNRGGTTAIANGFNGIVLSGARNTRIGGIGLGNIIGGNTRNGIAMSAGATGNVVIRNYIGVAANGSDALGNGWDGVLILDSPGNWIGGAAANEYNVISANLGDGVEIRGAAATGNLVQRGLIGTDLSGTLDRGNGQHGVRVGSSSNAIGTSSFGNGGNLISGNGADGVFVLGLGVSGNVIQGNRIGTDASGSFAIPNQVGVTVREDAANTALGVPGVGNLISGNSARGVVVFAFEGGVTATRIQANVIGLNAASTAALANGGDGIQLSGPVSGTLIGGADAGMRNMISGNAGHGILIGPGSGGNVVQQNWLGLAGDGSSVLGNGGDGLRIQSGGVHVVRANRIVGNGGDGIAAAARDHALRENSIHGNAGLGIELGADGVLANDAGDGDDGLQNYPLISAVESGGTTTLGGTLNSVANTTYRIEFYSNASCDPSTHGEGQTFVTGIDVTTDANGNATIFGQVSGFAVGTVFSATATSASPRVETSEFSPCVASATPPPAPGASNGGAICERQTLYLAAGAVAAASYSWSGPNGFSSTQQNPVISNAGAAAGGVYSVVAIRNGLPSAPSQTTATVNACRVAVFDASVTEGAEGTTASISFAVTLTHPSSQPVSVDFATSDYSTVSPGDFTPSSGSLVFAAGETSNSLPVTVRGDAVHENDEYFYMTLSNLSAGWYNDAQSVGLIGNDDNAPTVSLVEMLPCEEAGAGASGITTCQMKIRLSNPSSFPVSGKLTVASGGSPAATVNADFLSRNGEDWSMVTGWTEMYIYPQLIGDTIYEYDEQFVVTLHDLQYAASSGNSLTMTRNIVDDDTPPEFSVAPCVVAEGNAGTTPCSFGLQFAGAAERPLQLQYWTDVSGNVLAPAADSSVEIPALGNGTLMYSVGQVAGMWLVEAGNIEIKTPGQWEPAHLRQSIDLHGSMPGTIARDIATVAGQRYEVSFALSGHPNCALRVTGLNVGFGNQSLGDYSFDSTGHSTLDMGWRYQRQEVVANTTATRLRFASTTPGNCGSALDDFAVTPVGGGSAVSGIDFEPSFAPYDVPLIVAAGVTTSSIVVPVIGDSRDESDEDLQLWVCALDGGNCHPAPATIIDDDAPLPDQIFGNGFD